jgi:hypothetical protein
MIEIHIRSHVTARLRTACGGEACGEVVPAPRM